MKPGELHIILNAYTKLGGYIELRKLTHSVDEFPNNKVYMRFQYRRVPVDDVRFSPILITHVGVGEIRDLSDRQFHGLEHWLDVWGHRDDCEFSDVEPFVFQFLNELGTYYISERSENFELKRIA